MLGFLLTFFQWEYGLSFRVSFDKFIANNTHNQRVNFHSLRNFRYYTYLLKIFLETKKREFPEETFISTECKRITFLIFINKVMSMDYRLVFNTSLPRVLDDMRIYLKPNPENRAIIHAFNSNRGLWLSWILLHVAYFSDLRVFSLEFIRQRIIYETTHFLKLHKASNLKFPFIIEPFVVKIRSCLSQIQVKLKEFGFWQPQRGAYGPHQIIPNRILMNK